MSEANHDVDNTGPVDASPDAPSNAEFEAAFDAFADGREPDAHTNQSTEPPKAADHQDASADSGAHQEPVTTNASNEANQDPESRTDQPDTDKQPDTAEPEHYWKHRYESDQGRVNAYQRKADDAAQEVAALRRELETLKSSPHSPAAKNSDTREPTEVDITGLDIKGLDIKGVDLDELKEYSPEVHAALVQQTTDAQKAQEELNRLKNQLQDQEQALTQQATDDHHAAILAAHTDVNELINAPEFDRWLNQQSPAIRRITEDGSTEDVIWMLDQFKHARIAQEKQAKATEVHNKQKERLKQTATVPNRQQPSNKDDGLGDFESAFNHYADQQERGSS